MNSLFLFFVFPILSWPCQDLHIGFTTRTWYKPQYPRALKEAAKELGYSVRFSSIGDAENLKDYDGVIATGGHDIAPKYYTQNLSEPERKKIYELFDRFGSGEWWLFSRDESEWQILHEYFSNPMHAKTPYLGICYGMEMMVVYRGYPLIVDIKHQLKIENRYKVYDTFPISERSMLYKELGPRGRAYKLHHQALDMDYYKRNPSSHFSVTATSHDGRIPEIVEFHDRPAIGLQFHPEVSYEEPHLRLVPFKWLLKKACEKRAHTTN